jgi:hypothetical protein
MATAGPVVLKVAINFGSGRGLNPRSGGRFGVGQLQYAQAVVPVGDVGIKAGVGHRYFDLMHIVKLPIGVVHLIEARLFGLLDVDDGDAIFAIGDVGVSARHIHVVRVIESDFRAFHETSLIGHRHIDDFQTLFIDDEGIAELDGDGMRFFERNLLDQFRLHRVVDVDDDERLLGRDVDVCARDVDVVSAFEHTSWDSRSARV